MELAESIGLQAFAERDAAGSPLLEEDEPLLSKFTGLQLILGSDADQGEGTLFITPSRVIWLSSSDAARGFAADFTAISMHAVMSDPQSVDQPCLYVQLDHGEDDEDEYIEHIGSGEEEGSGGEEEAEGRPLPELRLVPADPATLDQVFQAFCEGAARNPDPDAEEEGEGELFCDEDEVLSGAAAAGMHLNEVDEIAQVDLDRFEDAEEEGEGAEGEGAEGEGMQNGGHSRS